MTIKRCWVGTRLVFRRKGESRAPGRNPPNHKWKMGKPHIQHPKSGLNSGVWIHEVAATVSPRFWCFHIHKCLQSAWKSVKVSSEFLSRHFSTSFPNLFAAIIPGMTLPSGFLAINWTPIEFWCTALQSTHLSHTSGQPAGSQVSDYLSAFSSSCQDHCTIISDLSYIMLHFHTCILSNGTSAPLLSIDHVIYL